LTVKDAEKTQIFSEKLNQQATMIAA